MKLYIRLDNNGNPIGNPITGDNLQQAFPGINLENNLPSNFAKFQRNPLPRHTVYEKYEDTTYEFVDGIVHDVHKVSKLSKAEIKQLQTETKERWKNDPNSPNSWKFDAAICKFKAPVPYPTDGKHYIWDETVVNWVIFDPSIHLPTEPAIDETIDQSVLPDESVIDETIDQPVLVDPLAPTAE